MTLRRTVFLAALALVTATLAPSAHADDDGPVDPVNVCVITNTGNQNTNACRDAVSGTGHVTGTGHTVGQTGLTTQRIASPVVTIEPTATSRNRWGCPAGTALLGGGWISSAGNAPTIIESAPDATDDTMWAITAINTATTNTTIQIVVQCTTS
ncbi:hypothetical protein AB0N09_40075 [Streptomyces erythrochromogenes]|uniref:hypothetical protein n=1 Tax=Streptomyces erythrochromogenes TaxID=285574 RepID=UPI00343C6ED0